MNDLKRYTTLEIIKKLVGHIDFYGETNYDNESLKNLDEVRKFLEVYLCKLYLLDKNYKDDYRASGKALANKARKILNNLKSYFGEAEDET